MSGEGFESITEAYAADPSVKEPGSTLFDAGVVIPDDATPTLPPRITGAPIQYFPIVQDDTLARANVLYQTTTPFNSGVVTFEINTFGSQLLETEEAYFLVEGTVELLRSGDWAEYFPTFTGTDGDQTQWATYGFWKLFSNLQIWFTSKSVGTFTSGFIPEQLLTHSLLLPQNYSGTAARTAHGQMMARGNTLGVDAFFGGGPYGGTVNPMTDLSLLTANPCGVNVKQRVAFKVPMKHLWPFAQTPGRFLTDDVLIKLQMQMVPEVDRAIRGTHIRRVQTAGNLVPNSDGDAVRFTKDQSIPILFIPDQISIVMRQYQLRAHTQASIAMISAERPLSMTNYQVTVLADQWINNADMSLGSTWGKGLTTSLVNSTGIEPKMLVSLPIADLEWGERQYLQGPPTPRWPWGVNGLIWKRKVHVPGYTYIRRLLIASQPKQEDEALNKLGEGILFSATGWKFAMDQRMQDIQQWGNYLEAEPQAILKRMENDIKLGPQNDFIADFRDFFGMSGKIYQALKLWGSYLTNMGLMAVNLGQDRSLDTIPTGQMGDLKVQFMTAPPITDYYGLDPESMLACFGHTDCVQYEGVPDQVLTTFLPPTAGKITQYWVSPQLKDVSYGRGRQTNDDFLYPKVPVVTSNIMA
jgi:hypothetical protein